MLFISGRQANVRSIASHLFLCSPTHRKMFTKHKSSRVPPPQVNKEEEKKKEVSSLPPCETERAAESMRRKMKRRRSGNYISPETHLPTNINGRLLYSISKTVTESCLNLYCTDEPSTIYKVPIDILRCNENAYRATVVCIGPYTHFARAYPPYRSMQDHKWRCVNKLILRHNHCDEPNRTQNLLDRCLMAMKAMEPRVRSCYSEDIQFDSDELAVMMLLDGCFILHLLLNQDEKNTDFKEFYESQVLGRLRIWHLVKYDLLLLDNQIPFFIIEKLFDLLRTRDDAHVDLVSQVLKLFSTIHLHRMETPSSIPSHHVHHLLHLFYLSIIPYELSIEQPIPPSSPPEWIPSATELQEAGVKFKKNKKALSFLEIKFSDGIMEIPPLEIHDNSNKLFRNLIAFEQCYPDTRCHITIYAAFMDCVINTPKDVRLLHLNGILTNRMGDDQGATYFFKRLCNQIHYASDKNYHSSVFIGVTKYHGSKWHKWRAGLVRNYFSNPWTAISVAAAAMLLLTVAQTFFAAYSYFEPRH